MKRLFLLFSFIPLFSFSDDSTSLASIQFDVETIRQNTYEMYSFWWPRLLNYSLSNIYDMLSDISTVTFSIKDSMTPVKSSLSSIDSNLSTLSQDFSDFITPVNSYLSSIDSNLSTVSQDLSGVDDRLDTIISKFDIPEDFFSYVLRFVNQSHGSDIGGYLYDMWYSDYYNKVADFLDQSHSDSFFTDFYNFSSKNSTTSPFFDSTTVPASTFTFYHASSPNNYLQSSTLSSSLLSYGPRYQGRSYLQEIFSILLTLVKVEGYNNSLFASQYQLLYNTFYDRESGSITSWFSKYGDSLSSTLSYASIDFPSNSVPQEIELTNKQGNFFSVAISLLQDQTKIQASTTMFLKHILEHIPDLSKKDTTEDENRIEQSISDTSSQLDSLKQSFEFTEISFKDSSDFFDGDSILSELKNSYCPSAITLRIPEFMGMPEYVVTVLVSDIQPFLDVSRAVFGCVYFVLIAGFVWFVFRLFIPVLSRFSKLLAAVLNW